MANFSTEESHAFKLDEKDPLKKYRDYFYLPGYTIYMDGNSLGLIPQRGEESLLRVINEWKTLGINGWIQGNPSWFYFAERLGAMAAPLVGAQAEEVIATGTTTINIHSLISTFFQPEGARTKILADELNFPTDIYALKGQLKLRGLDPDNNLILVSSEDGYRLDEDQIVMHMSEEVQVVLLPSVLYRSGQLLDMAYLTKEAHKRGILIGFDCSHSAGVVPHYFDNWGVDFAMWCSYKYLNSGPGSPGFLYLNRRHFKREPLLAGWFGYVKEEQFDMNLNFKRNKNAGGWQISTPGMLGAAVIEGSLEIFQEVGISAIREKSLLMTSYLIELLDSVLARKPYNVTIVTPRDVNKRGGHIAIRRNEEVLRICKALKARGVVADFRPPNIIRIAPVALYNTFHEIWTVVAHLKDILDKREFNNFSLDKSVIT